MKKITLLAALLITASAHAMQKVETRTKPLVSIDSISILQRSSEGKELANKIQKEVETFQNDLKNTQKDLTDQQESLTKQATVLKKDSILEKTEELNQKKKRLEREFADKEEALRVSIQKKQIALRDKQLITINEVFEKEGWGMLIDKNTPGLLCVSDAIDKTEQVLEAVDSKYKETATTGKTKTATLKTAAKETSREDSKKPSIKAA